MKTSRRDFLRGMAMTAAMAAASGTWLAGRALAADDGNTPEKWVKGVCRYCGTGCGVLIGVRNGKAVAIKGDPNNHNAGLLCLKGSLLIPVLNSAERVTTPMMRRSKGAPLEPVSWDEALNYVAERLSAIKEKYGPDAIQTTGSSRGTGNETNYVMQKFARAVIGTNNVDCCARV